MDTTLQVCNYYCYLHSKFSEKHQFFCSASWGLLFGHTVLLPHWKFHFFFLHLEYGRNRSSTDSFLPPPHTPTPQELLLCRTNSHLEASLDSLKSQPLHVKGQLLYILNLQLQFCTSLPFKLYLEWLSSFIYISFSKNWSTIFFKMVNIKETKKKIHFL